MSKLIKTAILLGGMILASPSYGADWIPAQDDLIISNGTYTVVKVTGPQAVTIAYECRCRYFIDEDSKTLFLLEVPKDICL